MGTYATTTSLEILLVGTTFDTATTSLVSKLITHAENEVNKYLSKRYDLSSSTFQTTTSIPPLVTSLTETIAEGFFYMRNARGPQMKDSAKRGQELVKMATENLKLIAEYKADLYSASGNVVADMSNTSYRVLSSTTEYSNTFNEDDELNWKIDQDKLGDISDERDS